MKAIRIAFWPVVAVAAWLGVFRLPFLFPTTRVCLSAAYAAGFNNSVAIAVAAGLSLIAFAVAGPVRKARLRDSSRMPIRIFVPAAVLYVAFLTGLAILASRTPLQYGETAQFLDRIDFIRFYGKIPYRDFQYAYGPLLLYLPAGLSWIAGLGTGVSYYSCLIAMSVAGLYFAFWTTNELVSSRMPQVAVFGTLMFFGLNPTLGMNYTYFRFATPVAAIVLLTKCKTARSAAICSAVAGVVLFSISPEIGVAFGAGALVYGLYTRRLAAAVVPSVGLGVWFVVFGRAYLGAMGAYAGGCFNFVVAPTPQTILLLAALIFVVPRMLVSSDALQMALYVVALAMLPGALGRADGGHIVWYELSLFWLIFSGGLTRQRYALAVSGPLIFWVSYCVFRVYATPLLQVTGVRSIAIEAVSLSELTAIAGKASVATPVRLDRFSEEMLKRTGRYLPEFHPDFDLVADAKDESIKIADMNRVDWALIPRDFAPFGENIGFTRVIFQFPVSYTEIRKPVVLGPRILTNLETNWSNKGALGDYIIYRRRAAIP